MTEESRFKTLRNSVIQVGENKIILNTILAAHEPKQQCSLWGQWASNFSVAWLEPVAEKAQVYHGWNLATEISHVNCLFHFSTWMGLQAEGEKGIQGAHVTQVFPEFPFPLHPAIPPLHDGL